MANSDVKVREIRLLESYSTVYDRFMDSAINMMHRFYFLFSHKDDNARDLVHKINDHLHSAEFNYSKAKAEYYASLKRNGGPSENEVRYRAQALRWHKQVYEKAKMHAESAKKLYKNIHGETNRVSLMTNRQREKLLRSKEDGDNFLKKAIAALNEYKQ